MSSTDSTNDPPDVALTEQDWRHCEKHFNLTNRELAVAQLLFADLTRSAIARKLRLSPSSVRHSIDNLYRKAGVRDRLELIKAILAWHYRSRQT